MKKEQAKPGEVAKYFHLLDRFGKAARRYEDLSSQCQHQKVEVDSLSIQVNDAQRNLARRYKLNEGDQIARDGTIIRKTPGGR